jgi:hypothetical protein
MFKSIRNYIILHRLGYARKTAYEESEESFSDNPSSINGRKLSNWIDAMNMQRGIPQIYGQYMINKGKGYESYDISEPEKLDERRKNVGLSTFDEHVAKIIKEYSEDKATLLKSYKKIFRRNYINSISS